MRWNTPSVTSGLPSDKSVTPSELAARPTRAEVSTPQTRFAVPPGAVKLLLLAVGASLVAGQLAKIALRSLRGTWKVDANKSFSEASPQKDATDEARIEMAAERKEWK
ncbi:MAG TPA: hypothetical protein VEU98_01145 [Candidatus Eremiobacteraceae bacterium]|nr:hypothetical protein [Candidatus Eremiobacteraceae bacterium]